MAIIELMICNTIFEANMIKNVLENEGISSFLTNENFTNLMQGYSGIMGAGIQIMIDEKDSEKALELVSVPSKTEAVRCPNCNSENVTFGLGANKFKKIVAILYSLLIFTPFNYINNTWYCNDCKTEFKK